MAPEEVEGDQEQEVKPDAEGVPLGEPVEKAPGREEFDHPAIRGLYLRRGDFKTHGWTEGCPKCRFMLLHPGREGGPVHSNQCKSIIVEALRATPCGSNTN